MKQQGMQAVNETMIELGELKVASARESPALVYAIPHLAAGIALTIYDPKSRVGGVAHVILPDSGVMLLSENIDDKSRAKYANIAVPALVEAFCEAGGEKLQAVLNLYGGAQLFNFGGGSGNSLNVGVRTTVAIRAALAKQGLVITKAETGGNKGRTFRFEIDTGRISALPLGGG